MIKTWSHEGKWGITIHIGNGCPPVYQQIIDQICFHVSSGHLQPGDKLPPVRELARALEVNFNTVGKAYHDLSLQGVILGKKGGGSAVAEKPNVSIQEKRRKIQALYENLIAEAALYGVSAAEIKNFIKTKATT